MGKYTTKYFGEIVLDETSNFEAFDTKYNGQDITVSLSDFSIYGDKIKLCFDIIDQYDKIIEISKNAIIEYFPQKNGTVNYYFKCHFEDMLGEDELIEVFGVKHFKKMDIKKVMEKMGYPDLLFGINNKTEELEFSVDYMVSKEYSDEILCVKMDDKLNVIEFSHES